MVVAPHYHLRQVFEASRIASLDPSDVNAVAV
jgi:hypothetical protein